MPAQVKPTAVVANAPLQIKITDLPLEEILHQTVSSFAGDLAYLALTSKPEGALRDRIALQLRAHFAATRQPFRVGREFGPRIDLAIVDAEDCAPRLFVELKSWHTMNAPRLITALAGDVAKCREVLARFAPGVPAYLLVALTHPLAAVERRFDPLVKYQGGVRKAHDGRDAAAVLSEFLRDLAEPFPELTTLRVPPAVGADFGVEVEIHWLLMGPISESSPRIVASDAVERACALAGRQKDERDREKRARAAAKSAQRAERTSETRRRGER